MVRRAAGAALLLALGSCGKSGGGMGPSGPGPLKTVVVTTTPLTLATLGRTAQFAAQGKDSSGTVLSGLTFGWMSSNPAAATVSTSGLVTAIANGTTNITANTGGITSAGVAVTVQQAPGIVTVGAPSGGHDTLATTGDTTRYAAIVKDSNSNVMSGAGAAVTWSSTATGVAGVSASGLATAVADGSTQITATAGSASGFRSLLVRRYASTFTLTPKTATISTAAGTQALSGTAADSSAAALPIGWTSRNTALATVSPASGTSTTVTAAGNGSVYIVITAGTRSDSSQITITGQPAAPAADTVSVGDFFFASRRNLSSNPAVDTLGVGGTVTWIWVGSAPHGVGSTGSPSFTGQGGSQTSGTFAVQFNTAGTYTYNCTVHGNTMTGKVIVK